MKQTIVLFALANICLVFSACKKDKDLLPLQGLPNEATTAGLQGKQPIVMNFTQVNLVGDNNEYAPARIDPNLINAWGISFSPTGNPWISSPGAGVSVVYNRTGAQVLAPVNIPWALGTTGGLPSGQVFNGSADFKLANNNPARFIFAGLDGTVSGWNGGTSASLVINDFPHAAYTGIALGSSSGANYIYLANFKENKINVYNASFSAVSGMSFTDPALPPGYAPFNIQNIDGKLYVMYAKVDPATGEEMAGEGLGYVTVYNTDGSLHGRFASEGQLNAPWGIAKAPASFFGEGGVPAIIVGNFGDGRLVAYTMDGEKMGLLRKHGQPVVIEGLWGIGFAPATATASNPNWLYFAAGPDDEEHGLFGYITKP
ncbi:MAG TPA: TIGR03118 family protein [Ferruginibacter sp.]|nr:TIGR03118 family protein [Ferruginibacter sp.]